MIRTRLFTTRLGLALILVLIMSASAYAFAASNDVPITGAGDGAGAISGYNVTDVAYNNIADPTKIGTVTFNIVRKTGVTVGVTPDPSNVQIRLITGGAWFNCEMGTSPQWSCTNVNVNVFDADNLQVVAVE